eukprot:CAMPEP_0181101490 /NCGR_PEP_ID=MMETSP1071-20121207/13782_1 /TAXON_ID=35127 /ORGANISM="Thalassiosira sp., Strain NH16" /LENGTH=548 /DNA_ID=CAMNT_0023184345 /DNA_START=50 /DNA_END=1696 /DNA_ORIENTATION=+
MPRVMVDSRGNSISDDLSTRSLTNHMIRQRNADVFDYYKEVRTLGEGSIGAVSLVRRKKGTEGGSAYNSLRGKENMVNIGCMGFFGCLLPKRKPPRIEKASDRSPRPSRRPSQSSAHSEEYALKSIQLRLVQRKYLDELRNEIVVLRSLDHPNIVKAYEVYETKANIYVLMEYCSGGDLYARAPYMENQAATMVSQICSAISHMHKNGVVHRDLKVENIMFESREPMARIKVLDFGLSKKFMPGSSGVMTEWVGTVYTMAPQVLNGIYDSKADCWSIGVIAFLLLCDEKPFRGKSRAEVIQNIKRGRYNFNAHGWYNISKEAKQFVASLLVHDPQKRLSAEEAVNHPWLKKTQFPVTEADAKATENLMGNVMDNILSYAKMSELKRIAAVVVAHKSSSDEILDMRKAFDKFDEKKDGVISMEEFKLALAEFNYTDEELAGMFSQMDVNNNGVILYTEFLAATLEMHGRVEEKRLAEAYDHIDDDDSGYISKENLIKLLGEDVLPSRVEKLIREVDQDGDGMISFEEFLIMFRTNNNMTANEGLTENGI